MAHGELDGLLTGAQATARWSGDGGGCWRPKACGGGVLGGKRGGKEDGVGWGEVR
jgi:hypothetical protein